MAQKGDLYIACDRPLNAEWNIFRLLDLSKRVDYEVQSPRYRFSNAEWYLRFFPNGEKRSNSDWISLYLNKEDSPTALHVNFTIGIKKTDGSVLESHECKRKFRKTNAYGYGTDKLIQKSKFLQLTNVLSPDGTLKIFCSVSIHSDERDLRASSLEGSSLSSLLEIDVCKEKVRELEEKLLVTQREKVADITETRNKLRNVNEELNACRRIIKALEGELSVTKKEKAALQNSKDKIQEIKHDLALSKHLKEIFQSGYEGDTTVRVGKKEFLVHKLILAARSSVFRVMFEADMVEKEDGVVNIEDCEPDHFEDFLLFLYSGEYDLVRPANALRLCLIADKYNVEQLKDACFEVMKNEMSAESVSDAVYMATLYDEHELLDVATGFFAENMHKVICTQKWLSFLSEHPVIANELLVKSVEKAKK